MITSDERAALREALSSEGAFREYADQNDGWKSAPDPEDALFALLCAWLEARESGAWEALEVQVESQRPKADVIPISRPGTARCYAEEAQVVVGREVHAGFVRACKLSAVSPRDVIEDAMREYVAEVETLRGDDDAPPPEARRPFWATEPSAWEVQREGFLRLAELRRESRRVDPDTLRGVRVANDIAELEDALGVTRTGGVA